MSMIFKTAREWWLVTICFLFLMMVIFPISGIELYPVLDLKGSNLANMETDKKQYRCGEIVHARLIFQKERAVDGMVKWALVPNKPNSHIDLYAPRPAVLAPGIYDTWIEVEKLPAHCGPGQYHFEGVVTYKLLLGQVSYPLRTVCFDIIGGSEK